MLFGNVRNVLAWVNYPKKHGLFQRFKMPDKIQKKETVMEQKLYDTSAWSGNWEG